MLGEIWYYIQQQNDTYITLGDVGLVFRESMLYIVNRQIPAHAQIMVHPLF